MMEECLVNEIFDVVNNIGVVVKKCEDIYKMVEVNKVFVYYCWQDLYIKKYNFLIRKEKLFNGKRVFFR